MTVIVKRKLPDIDIENLTGYGNRFSVLEKSKKTLCFHPRACKEEFYHCFGRAVLPSELKDYVELGGHINDCSKRKPIFVFFFRPSSMDESIKRVDKMLGMLAKKLKVKEPKISRFDHINGKINAVLVTFPQKMINSPFAVSAVATFVRAATNTSFSFRSLKSFIDKLVEFRATMSDAEHVWVARKRGTLDLWFKGKLPITSMKGWDAFKTSKCYDAIAYDGIREEKGEKTDFFNVNAFCNDEWYNDLVNIPWSDFLHDQ